MPGKSVRNLYELGSSLAEVLVSIGISSAVLLATSSLYTSTVNANHDQNIRTETLIHAQAAMQMIGNELKPLGNGVPFDQANFEIGESSLSEKDVSYPIEIANTNNSQIAFRLNETGEISLLTSDFNPASSTTVSVTDVSAYQVNDPIYISNGVVSGNDGLYAKIQSVDFANRNIELLGSSLVYSPSAIFAKGSILEEVPTITFKNLPAGAGISRDSGFGSVSLAEKATVSFEYLNSDGNPVSLPLTALSIVEQLRAIKVTVIKTSPSKLSTGQSYSTSVSQSFALRNLNILY